MARSDAPSGDGPPIPPWERDQRRRDRRALVLACAGTLALAVPTVLIGVTGLRALGELDGGQLRAEDAPAAATPDGDAPEGDAPDGDAPDGGAPDGDAPAPTELDPPDTSALDGDDLAFAEVFQLVDASEVTMIAAQEDIASVLAVPDPDDVDGDALTAAVSSAAGDGQRELQQLRTRFANIERAGAASELRSVYVSHLDAWVRYLVAVEDDPSVLVRDGADTLFIIDIDTTADEFSQLVREELPDGLDGQVRDYADAIVERGFPEREMDRDTV